MTEYVDVKNRVFTMKEKEKHKVFLWKRKGNGVGLEDELSIWTQ